MDKLEIEGPKLLLIDTCGETAGVALSAGSRVLAEEDLERGRTSADVVAAVRRLLGGTGWRLDEMNAVGVVTGPGSFTGMRTGLAAAMGFCVAASLRVVAVSRLEVLADAAGATSGFAALDAGRGEVYVREVVGGREWMCGYGDLLELLKTAPGEVVVAEERAALGLAACRPVLRALHVADSLGTLLRGFARGAEDVATIDANYVRGEQDIYRKSGEVAVTRA